MNINYLKNKNIHFVECENWHDTYGYEKSEMKEDTINYIEQLQQYNKQLKDKIDNAIEYVEERIVEDDYMLRVDTDMVQKELLDILNEVSE